MQQLGHECKNLDRMQRPGHYNDMACLEVLLPKEELGRCSIYFISNYATSKYHWADVVHGALNDTLIGFWANSLKYSSAWRHLADPAHNESAWVRIFSAWNEAQQEFRSKHSYRSKLQNLSAECLFILTSAQILGEGLENVPTSTPASVAVGLHLQLVNMILMQKGDTKCLIHSPNCYCAMLWIFSYAKLYVIILLKIFRSAAIKWWKMEKYLPTALTAGDEAKIAFQRTDLQQNIFSMYSF